MSGDLGGKGGLYGVKTICLVIINPLKNPCINRNVQLSKIYEISRPGWNSFHVVSRPGQNSFYVLFGKTHFSDLNIDARMFLRKVYINTRGNFVCQCGI